MLHHNPTETTLDFQLGPRAYTVPPGAEVEIPDHLEYCVKRRLLPLKPGPGSTGAARVSPTAATPLKGPLLPAGVTVREADPEALAEAGVHAEPAEPDQDSGEVSEEVQRAAAAIRRKGTARQEARLGRQAE